VTPGVREPGTPVTPRRTPARFGLWGCDLLWIVAYEYALAVMTAAVLCTAWYCRTRRYSVGTKLWPWVILQAHFETGPSLVLRLMSGSRFCCVWRSEVVTQSYNLMKRHYYFTKADQERSKWISSTDTHPALAVLQQHVIGITQRLKYEDSVMDIVHYGGILNIMFFVMDKLSSQD
jgi:hypothetical protein